MHSCRLRVRLIDTDPSFNRSSSFFEILILNRVGKMKISYWKLEMNYYFYTLSFEY